MEKIKKSSFDEQLKDKWRTMFYIGIVIVLFIVSILMWWLGEDAAPAIFSGGICGLIVHWMLTSVSLLELPRSKKSLL